jgi:NAD(P)-dependent dehydrogenase (short-subunit alcohol dehydrogenase family)
MAYSGQKKKEGNVMNIRVAVITGGAQGIGKAMVRQFLHEGYAVVMVDHDEEAGTETALEYTALGSLRFIPADVASEQEVAKLAADTTATFGGVNVLVNNAAIACNRPIGDLSLADWNRVLGVNLTGPWLCAKHFASSLRRNRGTIINIASTRALMSEPNTEAYSASKGGIVALTHALAASLAPEVRVNCISPGWIETESWRKTSVRSAPTLTAADHQQHWAGRVGQPEDIAQMALHLASDKSGFITGANIVVDGGMTRKMIYA